MTSKPRGLILITGASGCGKSTTLAAMVKHINDSNRKHIITLEDPIEFVHTSSKSIVSQRQIGRDASSFDSALRSAMREDPDVIMVGEMRDLETVRMALSAAERQLVRAMLSESLQAVASQTLLKRKSGGRVVASEIMVMTSAIKNLIRSDRVAEIYSALQTGAASGMTTMDQSLSRLVGKGVVSREPAASVQASRRAS